LWTALAALVVLGAGLQVAVTADNRQARRGSPAERATAGSDRQAGDVVNVIGGGVQHGPVLQGRDFAGMTFGRGPAAASQTSPDKSAS
jgi:hypothetical protein